jgi:ring-1,2-phenylacetyl-CoA epoxidase subunit PaaA
LYLYAAAETLGVSRDQLIADLHAGKVKYSSIFNYPTLTWADIGAIGWLVDGAAIMNQIPLCRCSYGRMRRAMVRICKEESFHQRQGFDILMALCRGTDEQKAMAQDCARTLVVAVAHDVRAARRRERAQRAVRAMEDQAPVQRRAAPALRRPDRAAGGLPRHHDARPRPAWNEERGHYDFGAIDWSEFHEVLKGNGPVQQGAARRARGSMGERRVGARAALALRAKASGAAQEAAETEWPLWEIFIRSQHGLAHKHVGSLHATDAKWR